MAEGARPDWVRRCQAVSSSFAELHVDALVVSTPANIRYLSGFKGSTAWLVVRPNETRIVTDGRYRGEVQSGMAAGRLLPMTLDLVESGYDLRLAATIQSIGARKIAFEADGVTVAGLRRWQQGAPAVEWVAATDLVERLRLIKDASELQLLRRAG